MSITPIRCAAGAVARQPADTAFIGRPGQTAEPANKELRETFRRFVGETFYGQMLHSMRKTVGKPAYFHGGRTEEVFQAQLDQVLAERMAQTGSESCGESMYQLFSLSRPS